jgi:hypothetical protein
MESPQERPTASMVDAQGALWEWRSGPELTTMPFPATPSTPNTTPSFKVERLMLREQPSTSQPSPASSAPTSSNTPRLEESLSYIEDAIIELERTLSSKNSDYRIDGEFSNFEQAAKTARQITGVQFTADEVIATQIGIKLGRLEGLPPEPNNESRLDTLKDLAGYAIILYAYTLSQSTSD